MSLLHWLSPAWRAHYAQIGRLDGMQPGTAEYDRAWHDRMGLAANRWPGSPEPHPTAPESQAEPKPEAEPW